VPLDPTFWDDDFYTLPPEDVMFAVEKPQPVDSAKQAIIVALIKMASGRQKHGVAWATPLRTRRDYTVTGRKTFPVEQIPMGALPIYDKEPCHTVVSVGRDHPAVSSTQP